MRVLLAGGGTAGHINPAISIADTIKKKQPKSTFLFVGTSKGMEANLVPQSGYDIKFVDVRGIKRRLTVDNVVAVFKALCAYRECIGIINGFKPDVVIGTGGYVSGPLLLAATVLKIPTLIHEQNVFAGMTSKMLSSRVDTVCISFERSRKRFDKAKNVVLTGNPVREKLFELDKAEARRILGIDEKPFLVAFGGSLGARRINEAMSEYIKTGNIYDCNILFATGEREYERVKKDISEYESDRVSVVKYIHNMDEVMQAADLLVCRAGAITVSELNALGKPSVLIPSPNVTDNHQYYNAKAVADKDAAVLIEEDMLDNAEFCVVINELLNNYERLGKMADKSGEMGIKNATELIYDEILKLLS